jgi:hypothetical protein
MPEITHDLVREESIELADTGLVDLDDAELDAVAAAGNSGSCHDGGGCDGGIAVKVKISLGVGLCL